MRETSQAHAMNPRLVSLSKPSSQDAERYQRLRLAVEGLASNSKGIVIAVTSPCDGEGKTVTAINLAGALAQNPSRRVLLMELDLRNITSSIKDYLGGRQSSAPGVADCIVGPNENWQQLAEYIPAFNLHLLTAGKRSQAPYEVLNAPRLGQMIDQARRSYDYIIIDTAAVTLYPDTQLISKWVDKFIVLVSSGKTSQHQLAECLDLMAPEKVMGIVLNECTQAGSERNGH